MDDASLTRVDFVLQQNVTSKEYVGNILVNEARDHLTHLDFKRIAICASGPSLADHVEDIRARQHAGWHVATMNGSHNFLIERGITPDLFFMVDARPVNLPFLRLANDQTTYVIASQCHPEIFEALRGRKVLVWSMFHDEAGLKAIHNTRKEPHPAQKIGCFVGSLNVGQSCLVPIWALGYKVWHLFGFDGSMRDDAKHAFAQPQNDGEAVQDFFWPIDADGKPIDGRTKRYFATPTMAHSAQNFPERVSYFRRLGIDVELFGDGLIPDMVAALASKGGAVTAPGIEGARREVPAPRPRRRPVDRLPFVCWKWKGHIPYFARDVNVWGNMVDRWYAGRHELVCITDDAEGIDGRFRVVPLWRDRFEHGRDWHRVKIFAEEMADLIGPRFVSIDLDTVICGPLEPLFDHDAPFKAWKDPNRAQYCTAVFQMDAGAYPHVWREFDSNFAIRLRQMGKYTGYDQAWISEVLPGQPMWTRDDGMLSFKGDVLRAISLNKAHESAKTLPAEARIINFHGRYNPRDADVQQACPWVAEYWR